jgi:predicted short-subunit dehydrogenase-like oxidoreductase (DUF2520 family)
LTKILEFVNLTSTCKKISAMHQRTQKKPECLSFIGAGRVGQALSLLFYRHGYSIASIIDIDIKKAQHCQANCHARTGSDDVRDIDLQTSVLLIAVPDDRIKSVSLILAESMSLEKNALVAHTSGLLPSDVLSPLRSRGIAVCSFHPCYTFTEDFNGEWYDASIALEGDPRGCDRLAALARTIGAKPFILSKADKTLYHAGCTMASNYIVSLMAIAQNLLPKGLQSKSMEHLSPLITATLHNMKQHGIENALTGPVQRGDIQTVKKHLIALKAVNTDFIHPYIELGRVALRIARRRGLPEEKCRALEDLFEEFGRNAG